MLIQAIKLTIARISSSDLHEGREAERGQVRLPDAHLRLPRLYKLCSV